MIVLSRGIKISPVGSLD